MGGAYDILRKIKFNQIKTNMDTKNFFASKMNWLGIAAIATALGDYLTSTDTSSWDWKTVTLFALGALTIVIRTWFTATAIK